MFGILLRTAPYIFFEHFVQIVVYKFSGISSNLLSFVCCSFYVSEMLAEAGKQPTSGGQTQTQGGQTHGGQTHFGQTHGGQTQTQGQGEHRSRP